MREFLTTNAFGNLFRVRISEKLLAEIELVQSELQEMKKKLGDSYSYEVEKEIDKKDFDSLSESRAHVTLKITEKDYELGQYWEEGWESMRDEIHYIAYLLQQPGHDEERKNIKEFLTPREINMARHAGIEEKKERHENYARFELAKKMGYGRRDDWKSLEFKQDIIDRQVAIMAPERWHHKRSMQMIWEK